MHDISRIFHSTPSLNAFEICHSGGCAEVSSVSLNDADWQKVSAIFAETAQNAEQERLQIAQAIGVLESIVGQKIGTWNDKAGTFSSEDTGQMDCNDEAINSTTYMRLIKQAGFMTHHEIEDTRTRHFFFNGWPHSTAVIHEIQSGTQYAVDSWFYDNGHAAIIVSFASWKAGYRPADTPIDKLKKTKLASPQ